MAGHVPRLGAVVHSRGTTFRVWAPKTMAVDLIVDSGGDTAGPLRLDRDDDGVFTGTSAGIGAGTRYRYLLDGDGPFPDPASRYQPDGVHGASLTVDPSVFEWTDQSWTGVPLRDLTVYELHVGTFSPAGTFAGVAEQLPALRDLGVTGIELMPVADFPGNRNWGYDGAALFAPARCYGSPDDLRRLVDTAHRLGLAVLLDVVYNHAGPDGAYLSRFSPYYFTDRHASPWGAGVDLDGPFSAHVREFFIENALHWIHEYHMDGLRLDATHAIHDSGPVHFLSELTARVKASVSGRIVHVIAEDHRNLAEMVTPVADGGQGLDGVWADDFHHQMRRGLAGDAEAYFRDFSGTASDLALTILQGWFFSGQHSEHLRGPRGTSAAAIPPERFVICLQNHDQIGNRAFGERLHHQIDLAAYRAASALLLAAPQTPLLFMGQEWAASTPFQFFTDHGPELGRLVTEGRRREFRDFAAFADDAMRNRIPDPQALGTFLASRLRWAEREHEPHASMLRFYAALLAWRRATPFVADGRSAFSAFALDDDTVAVQRRSGESTQVLVVARLRGNGLVSLVEDARVEKVTGWECLMTSEDAAFTTEPRRPDIECQGSALRIRFHGPAAVFLRGSGVAHG